MKIVSLAAVAAVVLFQSISARADAPAANSCSSTATAGDTCTASSDSGGKAGKCGTEYIPCSTDTADSGTMMLADGGTEPLQCLICEATSSGCTSAGSMAGPVVIALLPLLLISLRRRTQRAS
jgi:hypothetical protein